MNKSKLNTEMAEIITDCRIDILRHIEFVSIFFLNIDIYESDDIPTACVFVDPKIEMIISPTFFKSQSRKQRNFILIHETLHVFFEHVGRAILNAYHRELWNIACDYVINNFIVKMMKNDPNTIFEKPNNMLFDEKYDGMTSDQVYHLLLEENDNDPDKAVAKNGGGKLSSESGDIPAPLDKLSDEQMSKENKNKMVQEISAGIMISDNSSKNMSNGISDLVRIIKDLLEPQIHWSSLLQDFVTKASRDRNTYNRLSRRSSGRIVFPSVTGDHLNIVFGVDTSGSMSNDSLKEAVSELYSICETFSSWELTLISCDTESHIIGEYNSEDGDDFSDIDVNLVGGGGTELSPMIEFANESESEPNVCIIVTDGYIPEEPYDEMIDDTPVITIITSDGNSDLNLCNSDIVKMN